MSKQPIVRLYYLTYRNGDTKGVREEVISPLLYKGENIGEQFVHMFKYSYVAQGDDTGTLVLLFPFTNLSLELLNKGTYLHIEWGYLGFPLNYRQVAIEDLSLKYDQTGCRLTLELISITGFLDKNPSWEPTIGEMLEEKSVTLVYTVNNPIQGGVQTYVFEPNAGPNAETLMTMYGTHNPNRVPRPSGNGWFSRMVESFEEHNKELIKQRVAEEEARNNQVFRRSTATELQVGIQTGPHPFLQYNKTYAKQKLTEAVMAWLTKYASMGTVATRDRDLRGLEGFLDSSPVIHFTTKPSLNSAGIISISVEQPSTPYEVGNDTVLQIDPNTKKVICQSTRMVDDLSEEISEAQDYMFVTVIDLVNGQEVEETVKIPIVYYKKEPFLFYGEEIVRLTKEQEENFTLSKTMRNYYGPRAFDKDGLLKPGMVDRYNEDMIKQKRVDQIRYAFPAYGARTVTEARELLDSRKLDPGAYARAHSTLRIDTRGPEAAKLNRSELLHEYFSQIGCKVTVEGNAFIEASFNFSVSDCADYIDGIYFCVESDHQIIAGAYKTIVSGARVPSSIHMQNFVNEGTVNLKEVYAEQISEHYRAIEMAQKGVVFGDLSSSPRGFGSNMESMWLNLKGQGYIEDGFRSMDLVMPPLMEMRTNGKRLIVGSGVNIQVSKPNPVPFTDLSVEDE